VAYEIAVLIGHDEERTGDIGNAERGCHRTPGRGRWTGLVRRSLAAARRHLRLRRAPTAGYPRPGTKSSAPN